MKKDDSLWKGILEDVFPYFLYFFFPDADKIFDLNKGIVFLDKELNELFPIPENGPAQRFVDKLAKAFLKNGKEQWILIHIEVQSKISADFPGRMYEYQYRIRDRYRRPVVAFAIFCGKRTKPIPDQYTYSLLGTSLTYRYNTFLIAAQNEKALIESNNPFAMVVLIAKRAIDAGKFTDDYLLSQNKQLARLLFSKDFSQPIIRSIMNFLKNYIHFEDTKYYINFDKEVALLTSNKKTMGIEELLLEKARKQGEKTGEKRGEKRERERAEKRFVASLIKSTDFTDDKIASIAGVSLEFVKQVKAEAKK